MRHGKLYLWTGSNLNGTYKMPFFTSKMTNQPALSANYGGICKRKPNWGTLGARSGVPEGPAPASVPLNPLCRVIPVKWRSWRHAKQVLSFALWPLEPGFRPSLHHIS